jgi:hypothetical protein
MANMPQMHNTNPVPLHHVPNEGVIKGLRTTATPRLSPERVGEKLGVEQQPIGVAAHPCFAAPQPLHHNIAM